MDTHVLDRLKEIEFEMLKTFISICEKHNLQYYLIGGSCLGAVRHKGFIPWDDDIDVGMPRSDYEKFLKIAQNELPEHIFLQTHQTDPEYYMAFAKLRNSDTTFIEIPTSPQKINHGVYLDIFPLDGAVTKGTLAAKWFKLKKYLYLYRISSEYNLPYDPETSKDGKLMHSVKHIIRKVVSLCYINLEKTVIKNEKLFKKTDLEKSSFIANHGGAWGEREIVPKEIFGSGTKGYFEGIEVILPEKYHEYLTSLYGDYMTPPPPEKRVGHHYCTVIDTEKSYKFYVEERR